MSAVDQAKWRNLPPPPGFSTAVTTTSAKTPAKAPASAQASYESLKAARAWDLALAPAKSLPMQALMLYMSGGGVQIFSLSIVGMLLLSPFRNLAAANAAFAPFAPAGAKEPAAPTALPLQKLAYLACNVATLALGLWKCSQMGLVPVGTGDWLAFETRGPPPEVFLS